MELERNTFICPRCGKHESFENSFIRAVIVDVEFKDLPIGNRQLITQKYYSIRVCSSCNTKMTINRILRHLFWIITPPILLSLISNNALAGFGIGLIVTMFLHVPIVEVYRNLNGKSKRTKELIRRAQRGNALVR